MSWSTWNTNEDLFASNVLSKTVEAKRSSLVFHVDQLMKLQQKILTCLILRLVRSRLGWTSGWGEVIRGTIRQKFCCAGKSPQELKLLTQSDCLTIKGLCCCFEGG